MDAPASDPVASDDDIEAESDATSLQNDIHVIRRIERFSSGLRQRRLTRSNFLKSLASNYYRAKNLDTFGGELLQYGLTDQQEVEQVESFEDIEATMARGALLHPEFEQKFSEFSIGATEITRDSPPLVVNRLLNHLSRSLIRIALRFQSLGGHIGLYTMINDQNPIFVRSAAASNTESFIAHRMLSYESLFVQEAERALADENAQNLSPAIPTHNRRNFSDMNSDNKKEEIHRMLLQMFATTVGRPNSKRIQWSKVNLTGWPREPRVTKKISNMTVEELILIKNLIDNNTIKMTRRES